MRRRLFIAVNIPEKVKNRLVRHVSKYKSLPARWTKKDNIHITLVFLGYVKEEEMSEIIESTKQVATENASFVLKLNGICYGPPKKTPRMVWAMGRKSEELGKLHSDLENALVNAFKKESRPYSPHITLARLRQWEFRRIDDEERPEIDDNIDLTFQVDSIELMESKLKKTGAEYIVLESFPLKQ